MSDLRKQAERLVELDEERSPGELNRNPWDTHMNGGGRRIMRDGIAEFATISTTNYEDDDYVVAACNHAPSIARAYLAECEAHERTRERLAQGEKALDEIANWNEIVYDEDGREVALVKKIMEMRDLARKVLASIEQKEGDE